MVTKGQIIRYIDFSNSTVDLGTSVRHIDPDSGVIMKNWDLAGEKKGLVGRYGTTTVNVSAAGVPDPLAEKVPIAIYRTANEDTGNKYILLHYDDGGGVYKLAYLQTNPAPTPPYFTTINLTNGSAASTTSANSLSFVTARDPGDGAIKVFMTNGVDPPFYWDFTTDGITPFTFGGAAVDLRIRFFAPQPWKGSLIAFGRVGEQTKLQFSDTNDFTKWIAQGNSSFIDCPPNAANQYLRSANVVGDRLIVGTTDIIGEVVYTGQSAAPWRFRILEGAAGHVFPRATTVYYGSGLGGIVGMDKRAPYLRFFNGNHTQNIDPKQTIQRGFQKWVDASDLENIRMDVKDSSLHVSFKCGEANSATGTDGKRWLTDIEMAKVNQYGSSYYPLSMWDIHCTDLAVADEGTDFGFLYYIDSEPQNISGTDYYFLRRLLQWSDVRAGGVGFGDNRGISGVDPTAVTYQLRTGYLDFGYPDWKTFYTFFLSGDWEGTPSTGAQLDIKYRFDNEPNFTSATDPDTREILIDAVRTQKPFPFSINAQGRLIQFDFQYSDTQSRPLLYKLGVGFVPKPGIR